jgi:hypothetical protein
MKAFARALQTSAAREPAPAAPRRARPHRDPGTALAGNLALQRALGIRAKLEVSHESDPEEREADRTAEAFASRDAATPERSPQGGASGDQPLPPGLRLDYERFFGADLSSVRIHAGAGAADASRTLRAKAFAMGSDVYFGSGEYRPASRSGRKLLAHELAHVVRARDGVHRSPEDAEGSAALHEDLIEQYRAAHGLPPHGIDPLTGQRVGPSDAEIRFGPLDEWVRLRVNAVPAPRRAPQVIDAGWSDVRPACAEKHKDDDNQDRDKYHICRRHYEFVENVYPQAVENIKRVPSPYRDALVALYEPLVPKLKATAPAYVRGARVGAAHSPGTLSFAGTTHTFGRFGVMLFEGGLDKDGEAISVGGPNAIVELNKTSINAGLKNMPAIEDTMVHEAIHIFMKIIDEQNRNRAKGTPVIAPPLARDAYADLQNRLENAVRPFVTQIHQLPPLNGTASQMEINLDVYGTAHGLISEAFGFLEAEIYKHQRAGQAYGAMHLPSLPPFLYQANYWEPETPPGLEAFIKANHALIQRDVEPVLLQVGERYLSLRP